PARRHPTSTIHTACSNVEYIDSLSYCRLPMYFFPFRSRLFTLCKVAFHTRSPLIQGRLWTTAEILYKHTHVHDTNKNYGDAASSLIFSRPSAKLRPKAFICSRSRTLFTSICLRRSM
ncbi:unnamed protein product, partial [Ectocarpus sp. 6 AP-2014]